MLQWTGGSRRKVTTSRKSTQHRQKQYFEQRKRQQQAPGLESYADGSNKCAQYHESRSLDILSLINLARVAQECSLGRTIDKLREGPDVCASQVGDQVLKYSPTTLKSKIIHGDSTELKESKTRPSVHEAERISPNKAHAFIGPENVWPSENCSSNTRAVKRDEWGTTTENLSVLDLLSDDGSHGNLEGRSVHEAHVAFSVEGLGKVGMETPVHSPREVGRNFFNGLSPPKAGRRFHSSKNHKYIMDDLDLELSSVIHDIGMPLNGNSSELLSNSRCILDHSVYSKNTNLMSKGHMPLDGYGGPKDDFLDQEENFYTDTKEKIEQPWNGNSDFLDGNFLGEWHFGVAWKNEPFQMNSETAKLVRANEQEMFDYGFDDFYVLNGRDEEEEQFKFRILDSPAPYFKHSAPKNDYEFKAFDEERCPAAAGSWDFKSMSNQHAWSYLEKDNLMNSFSSLSEESCSSSAVKGVTTSSLPPAFMKLNWNKINHGNEVWRSSRNQHSRKNLYAEKTACKNWGEILRKKHLKGVGISMKAPNLSRSKTDHYLNDHSAIQAISEPPYGSVFDGECTSVDVDSPLSQFCRTVETDTTSLDYKFVSEDLLGSFPNPKLDSNPESSCKRSKFSSPIDFPPSRSFFSEKDVLQKSAGVANSYDPLIFSDVRSRLRKPNVHLASNLESQPPCSSFVNSQRDKVPDLSVQLNDSKDDEDESEFQPTACGITLEEPQKEVSVGNNDLSPENESNVVAADMKDNSSEHKEVKDGTLEPVKSPKTGNYDDCVEEVPAEEIPEKLDIYNNNKQFHSDPGASVHSQNDSKGIEIFPPERRNTGNKRSSSDESSYQVMLESYVLQLLCVQKVLKGASE